MQNNFDKTNDGDGGQPSISFEKAWASLQPQLDKEAERRKKKRRRVVFFWLSIIAIGLVSGLVYNNGKNTIVGKTNLPRNIIKTNASSASIVPAIVSVGLMKDRQISNKKAAIAIEEKKDMLRNNPNTKPSKDVIAKNNNDIRENSELKPKVAINKVAVKANNKTALTVDVSKLQELKPSEKSNLSNDTSTVAVSNNALDTLKKVDSTVDKKALVKDIKKTKKELLKGIHFGLQFNAPLHAGINTLDVNNNKQPLSLLVPKAFISKQLGNRSSIWISATPYAQFYLNNSVALSSSTYNVTVQQGSTQNSKPKQYVYRETIGINKLISMEASLGYKYQLSNKLSIVFSVANNWLQSALINSKITMNNTTVTHDSLYGNDNSGKEWRHLNPTFLLGKFDVGYHYRKIEVGAEISAPISGLTSKDLQYKTPTNTNVFIRWYLK